MSEPGKKLSLPAIFAIVGVTELVMLVVGVLIQLNWKPVAASTFAGSVDFLDAYIYYTSLFFTMLIAGVLIFFLLIHQQTDRAALAPGKSTHSTALELTWTIIPIFLVLSFFVMGFKGYLDMAKAPIGSYPVIAHAKQWSWLFEYPNGHNDPNLHIRSGQPVEVTLQSGDVLHALYVPQFRAKKDVVPGRYNQMWFEAPWDEAVYQKQLAAAKALDDKGPRQPGDPEMRVTEFDHPVMIFDLYCAEYCGKSHSQMNRKVIVHKDEGFDAWLAFVSDPTNVHDNPVAYGQNLWSINCKSCHSIDGTEGRYPTWKNNWGKKRELVGGGDWSDRYDTYEEYVRAAIYVPQKDVVAQFAGEKMSAFSTLSQRDLMALMQFMKSLSDDPQIQAQAFGSWEAVPDTAQPPAP